MNKPARTVLNITDTEESLVPPDVFSKAVGSGYASLASFIGINGNGGFKAAMKMELRDLLVTAAQVTQIHGYAEKYVDGYEAEDPSTDEERIAKETRRRFQKELAELWWSKLDSYHLNVGEGITGMEMYRAKFRYMVIDPEKTFRRGKVDKIRYKLLYKVHRKCSSC